MHQDSRAKELAMAMAVKMEMVVTTEEMAAWMAQLAVAVFTQHE